MPEGDSGRLIGSFSRVERRNEAWPNYFRSPAHCHVLTALFSSATQPFLVIVNDPARTWPVTSISEHAGMVCYLGKIVTYLGTPDRPRNRCPASGLEKSSSGSETGIYTRAVMTLGRKNGIHPVGESRGFDFGIHRRVTESSIPRSVSYFRLMDNLRETHCERVTSTCAWNVHHSRYKLSQQLCWWFQTERPTFASIR